MIAMLCGGFLLVSANQIVNSRQKVQIEYRYLPRDLDTYIRELPPPSLTHGAMFSDRDVIY